VAERKATRVPVSRATVRLPRGARCPTVGERDTLPAGRRQRSQSRIRPRRPRRSICDQIGSGTLNDAAVALAGWPSRTASTWLGEILSPLHFALASSLEQLAGLSQDGRLDVRLRTLLVIVGGSLL
jgi:hypothetical protein